MISRHDSLAILWKSLKPTFDKMLSMQDISKREHASIYDGVYGYCINVDKSVQTANVVLGSELYKKLRSYLKTHVQSLKSKIEKRTGSDLLTFYEKNWTNYRVAAKYINNRCNYINRNWIKNKADEGQHDIVVIYELALSVWRDDLLKPCKDALQTSILKEIESERRGETIAATRLNIIISSLVDLCSSGGRGADLTAHYTRYPGPPTVKNLQANSTSSQVRGFVGSQTPAPLFGDAAQSAEWRQCLPIYREYFEQPFLRETMHFYDLEGAEFIKSNSYTDYLKRVENRVDEERSRAHTYLHGSTLNELIKTCEQSLIGNHIDALAGEFPNLLMENRTEDLARMYKALSHFPDGEARLVQNMELHVDKIGSEALREVAQSAKSNPKLFVDTIIDVQRKNKDLLQAAFANNAAFSRALDKGCERFINRNAVTTLAGSSRKSPELLAKYADGLLRKGTKEGHPGDLEESLGNVMEVFKYVDDKDVFQKFYSNTLARRLVNNMSVSEDAEGQMISLLKGACGFEYTSKLQRMFHDISSSRELVGRFDDWVKRRAEAAVLLQGVDFSIMVLSSNAWPFQAQGGFNVPTELESCFKVFMEFYQSDHEGRKLSWCYQLSRGEVITHYTKMRYTFQVSTYQMAILMLYNSALCYTVGQIQSQTGIEMSTLTQMLHILLKGRILKCDDGDAAAAAPLATASKVAEPEELTPDMALRLYTDYNNKRIRVNLNLPVKSEAKHETDSTLKTVESDRKLSIQACVVRIMKMRKRMEHQQLIREIIEQMSSRFSPQIQQIKLCINSLIEREFIKRDPENHSTYEYLA